MTHAAPTADELVEQVHAVVEDNALFVGYAEDTRYWIPHEAIVALAWFATAVVMPILTNLASDAITERRRRRQVRDEVAPPELADGAVEIYRREITETIAVLPATKVDESSHADAVDAAADLLVARGWPIDAATADAALIVERVRECLNR